VRGTRKGIWLLIAMVALFMLALGTAASAQVVQDGPVPPELGDPVDGSGNIVPHGGYSSSTNFCMQCHDVHAAAGDYALMANASVTATCATCHSIYGGVTAQPAGGPDPTAPPVSAATNALGTVSSRSAYDNTSPAAEHTIGVSAIPTVGPVTQSDWAYSWSYMGLPTADATTAAGPGTAAELTGGLYCATCHTPHGEYGQMVNNWTAADEGTSIVYEWTVDVPNIGDAAGWLDAWLDLDGSWFLCRLDTDVVVGGGHGTDCIDATIQDAEDQQVSLFGYKLLSAFPNHTYSTPQSYNTEQYNHDGANWCVACHANNDISPTATVHNHPTGCSACHGNPTGDTNSTDFPHTSSADRFLIDYPDALCIDCHEPGTLP